ncbi:MAG: hypothetical protein IAE84_13530 [Saprospiraceae bacterium]|jgi:hypothetical protein|nr:hypothetical protein [Saprospiraceae bacterium]HRD79534.1 hypothetical protein [Saprospiraceae bacterium]HRF37940.1 hypothetical protein [Saprospiraceae bacterium]HRJ13644.1 hypothetical protein [Saprospiraceae bacterium]HRK82821.1 hypothetical protein [Saprospiraceae bacterium]
MLQTCTRNDLIRFIYRETTLTENLAVRQALDEDIFLREAYEELYEGYRQLPKATFSPAPSAVRNILAYSAQTALEQQY